MDSIQLAINNHRGLPPIEIDFKRSRDLCEQGDPIAVDEVVHYHNRHAVSAINRFDGETACEDLEDFIEWRSSSTTFAPESLISTQIHDWQYGALLGTYGQALCFRAFNEQNPLLIEEALGKFKEAEECFSDEADISTSRLS